MFTIQVTAYDKNEVASKEVIIIGPYASESIRDAEAERLCAISELAFGSWHLREAFDFEASMIPIGLSFVTAVNPAAVAAMTTVLNADTFKHIVWPRGSRNRACDETIKINQRGPSIGGLTIQAVPFGETAVSQMGSDLILIGPFSGEVEREVALSHLDAIPQGRDGKQMYSFEASYCSMGLSFARYFNVEDFMSAHMS